MTDFQTEQLNLWNERGSNPRSQQKYDDSTTALYPGADTRKKWTSSKFPGFPVLSNIFPIFPQRFPDFSLTKFFKVHKCERCGSLNPCLIPLFKNSKFFISNKIWNICVIHIFHLIMLSLFYILYAPMFFCMLKLVNSTSLVVLLLINLQP